MKRKSINRPLGLHRRIAIYKHAGDNLPQPEAIISPDNKDGNGLLNSPPRHKKIINIPTPEIVTISDYDQLFPSNYDMPTCYIRYVAPSSEEEEEFMEYEADQDDIDWLENHPVYGKNGKENAQVSVDTFEKVVNTLEILTSRNCDIIPSNDAEVGCYSCFTSPHPEYSKLISDIRTHWLNKRHKIHKPLCRRYWPQTPVTDTNPHLVFRPREKERYKLRKQRKSDEEAYNKLKELQNNLDEAKQIIELVLKKEKIKLNSLEFMCEEYQQRLFDIDPSNTTKERKRTVSLIEGLKDITSNNYSTLRPKLSSSSSSNAYFDENTRRRMKLFGYGNNNNNIMNNGIILNNNDNNMMIGRNKRMCLSLSSVSNTNINNNNNNMDLISRNNKLICSYLNHIAIDGDHSNDCIPIIGLGQSLDKSTAMVPPLLLPKSYKHVASDIGNTFPVFIPSNKYYYGKMEEEDNNNYNNNREYDDEDDNDEDEDNNGIDEYDRIENNDYTIDNHLNITLNNNKYNRNIKKRRKQRYLIRPRVGRGGRIILSRIPVDDNNRWYNKTEKYLTRPPLFTDERNQPGKSPSLMMNSQSSSITELAPNNPLYGEESIVPFHPLPDIYGTPYTAYNIPETDYCWDKIYSSVKTMTLPSDALKVRCPTAGNSQNSNSSELFRFNI